MKKALQISLLLFFCFTFLNLSFSQSIKEIQSSSNYLWGMGMSADYKQADLRAMDDLISKISVQVYSVDTLKTSEVNGKFSDYYKSVINTYSSIKLSEAKQIMEEKNGEYTILRYLKKIDIQEIFKQRIKKIKSYSSLAQKAEKECRIGDAIRYYYWSYTLLQSHPDNDEIEIELPQMGKILMNAFLHDRINSLFTNMHFKVYKIVKNEKIKSKSIYLNVTYKGNNVENLDYRYYTGKGFSNLRSAGNGIALIELFDEASLSINNIDLIIEYEYINKCFDGEMKDVLETINVPFFKKSKFKINISSKVEIKSEEIKLDKQNIVFEKVNLTTQNIEEYEDIVCEILNSTVKAKDKKLSKKYFTAGGYGMYDSLFKFGEVKVLPFTNSLKVVKVGEDVLVRSIAMSFYFKNNNRTFIENVVFTFDKEKKVSAVSFALSNKAIFDILNMSENFGSLENKYQLIKFLEYYKTAFSLKRLNYIKSIFAKNALIIVGSVLKEAEPIDNMYLNLGKNKIKYITLSKKKYIERLSSAFKSKEFINISFEDNIVNKVNGNDKIYGIQIAQHYYSSNYNDFGYLFLMIDLNDSIKPKIYVRTWQPEKNDDGSIYGLNDFNLY